MIHVHAEAVRSIKSAVLAKHNHQHKISVRAGASWDASAFVLKRGQE